MNLLKEEIRDSELIEKLIPQKAPIVMVDKLLYYDESKVISGLTISKKNMFVEKGHFTEPGLIEHMAQTVALFTGYHFYINNKKAPEGYIGAIKGVTIYSLPKIEENLETEVVILQEIMGVTLVKGVTRCNGVEICSAEMKTVLKTEV